MFDEKLFWEQIDKTGDCWEWQGSVDANGYGIYKFDNKAIRAHRLAWSLENGDIPEGLFICHKCDNPPCCNPDHLYAGTPADNARDRVERYVPPTPMSHEELSKEIFRKVEELWGWGKKK